MKAVVLDPTTTAANVAGEPVEVGVHGPTGQRVGSLSERLAAHVAKHFPHLEVIEDEAEHFLHLDEYEAQLEADAKAAEATKKASKKAPDDNKDASKE